MTSKPRRTCICKAGGGDGCARPAVAMAEKISPSLRPKRANASFRSVAVIVCMQQQRLPQASRADAKCCQRLHRRGYGDQQAVQQSFAKGFAVSASKTCPSHNSQCG